MHEAILLEFVMLGAEGGGHLKCNNHSICGMLGFLAAWHTIVWICCENYYVCTDCNK